MFCLETCQARCSADNVVSDCGYFSSFPFLLYCISTDSVVDVKGQPDGVMLLLPVNQCAMLLGPRVL